MDLYLHRYAHGVQHTDSYPDLDFDLYALRDTDGFADVDADLYAN